MTHPPYSVVTSFVPANCPCGSVTRQLPTQKSNWRYSGAEHGFGGVVDAPRAADDNAIVIESAARVVMFVIIFITGSSARDPKNAPDRCAEIVPRHPRFTRAVTYRSGQRETGLEPATLSLGS